MSATVLSHADSVKLASIEQEEISLRVKYPSVFFTPNGKQEEFIKLVGSHDQSSGKVNTYLFSGANDTGKTRVLKEIVVNLAVGVQAQWFDHGLFRTIHRPLRIRIISTEQALKEGLLRELSTGLEPYLKPGSPTKDGHTYYARWELTNGTIIEVYTWQQGMTAHAGAFIDVLVLDEPGPRGIYDEATSRLRRGGPVIWGCTPVDAQGGFSADVGWFYDEIARAEAGTSGNWFVMYADAEDNCVEHGIRGRVPHAVIADRYERWKHDPAMLKARFYGKHALELGRVLKEWDVKVHVCREKDYTPQPTWATYSSLDYHPSRAQVYIYCKLTPFHELYVMREIVHTGLISEMAQKIRQLHLVYGEPLEMTIDPLAAVQNPITGTSVLDVFHQHKLMFRTAGPEKSDKAAGINLLREMLRGVNERPLLRVNESCELTISQASRWMTDQKTLQPAKENDDTWECLYRIALALPQYPTQARQTFEARQRRFRPPLVV